MGRIDTNEVQYHQGLQFEELHQTPPETIDDAPPNEDDLYQPPSDYQPDRPPPPPQPYPPHTAEGHSFPPQNHDQLPPPSYPPPPPPQAEVHSFPPQNHDQPPQAFPPAYDSYPDKPQAFPPPPPIMGNQYHHQQQPNVGIQVNYQGQVVGGVPVGASPSPLLQQPQYQPPTQPWRTQLFDCMEDPQNAVITLFFPCVTFGQIAEIMDSGNTPCATSGMLYTLIACCIAMPCIMSCTYRSKMRSKFGLIESPAPDWLVHCFCECCALCQEYRELQERGFDPSIGWLGNVAKQQQKQQQFGMTPPMQQRMM